MWVVLNVAFNLLRDYLGFRELHHWRIGGGEAPSAPKCSQFHAVFWKFCQNYMFSPLWRVGAPSCGESWIRPFTLCSFFPSIINRGVNLALDTFQEVCYVWVVFVMFYYCWTLPGMKVINPGSNARFVIPKIWRRWDKHPQSHRKLLR